MSTGKGLEELVGTVGALLGSDRERRMLKIPSDMPRFRAVVYRLTEVADEKVDTEGNWWLELLVDAVAVGRLEAQEQFQAEWWQVSGEDSTQLDVMMKIPGVTPELPAMKSVGYRQVLEYLRGEVDLGTMRQRALSASRQLAKRQLTWSRNTAGGIWLDAADPQMKASVCRYFRTSK